MRTAFRTPVFTLTLVACAAITLPSQAAAEGRTRIIDACAFITTWEPARRGCYDMWKRWCPMIANVSARARCAAVLDAAKAGRKPPPLEPEAAQAREPDKPVSNRGGSASSTDEAGVTTTSVRNPDGSRTVTRTDANGKVIESRVEPRSRPTSASATDPATGITTTSSRNADGSRTVTRTDAQGKVLSSEVVPASAPASASATDTATGVTTTSTRNDDGSRTVTRTDAQGKVLSSEVVPADAPAEASSTDAAGNTTKSVRNADGSRTVTVTDAQGKVLSTETQPASAAHRAEAPEVAAKPANPAPRGAKTLGDICALMGDQASKDSCYTFGKVVRSICGVIGDPRGRSECLRITAAMPERLGPFDE